ncbi:MAG TPA: AI-2E family transporter [Aliidongia sp.]|uniref:AI-2E family transporter n=1 Tax=Aliidongia sp. TaxID=1914230 RepID=UPI002DDDA651|nr:AI-2E family transporter [Aliidongia sp.]HEV2678358.1 AI-2E family transporter [Aliidongia sp.]
MTLLAFFAIVAALYFAREVLIPLTLAVLLSILLAPLVGLLRRLRLGRVPAVLLAVVVAVGLICAIGGLIGTQIAELVDNVPAYAQTIESKAGTVRTFALDQFGRMASRLGYDTAAPKKGAKPAAPVASLLPQLPAKSGPQPMPVEVHQPDPSPMELAERYLSPILSPLGTVAIILVVAIFVLLQQDDLRDRLIRLFGSSDLRRTTVALDDGGRRLSRYFLTQLGINTAFGCVIGVGLLLIGVPSPLLWGVMAGLLRFVPYVGSIIAAMFPMALAAAVDPGWSMVLWAGGLFIVVEAMVGQMIEPLLYGHSTGLSPISVVVAAIFWSWLWGPIGLILSTPLTLCLVVLGRHVEQLEFLDVMLGDRPALTPVESFYHRMLAGDQDEARDHAEHLLKELSLIAYYDDVALPGLELAAVDAQRGALTTEQLDRIKETIKELVEDLSGHLDRKQPAGKDSSVAGPSKDEPVLQNIAPPGTLDPARSGMVGAWRGPTPVLCVAGRGPLDEAAASMLCQLLSKHGIGARIAPYEAATRGNINLLETNDVAIVCVSYLDISGKHAHLRYLLQRLRQRMPATPFVVGLWPSEDPSAPDRTIRAELGADFYTRTLREAVDICLGIARDSASETDLRLAAPVLEEQATP